MKCRMLVTALLASALLAPCAGAQVVLEVGDCGGAPSATWTCTSNTGTAVRLVASFIAPAGLHPIGQESILEFAFDTPVPDWWRIGTGECRLASALSVSFAGATYSCVDFFGTVVGGVTGSSQYLIGPIDPGTDVGGPLESRGTRLIVRSMVDSVQALQVPGPDAGDQVFLFSVTVNKSRTTGTGSCAGCVSPGCAILRSVNILQPALLGRWGASGASGWAVTLEGGAFACYVPAHRGTWGQVKALYR